MKHKLTTPLLAAIGAVVLMLTLFLSFYFSTSAYRAKGTGIVLPSESAAQPPLPAGDSASTAPTQPALQSIEVTPENAQAVIASLARPAAYSYTVRSTLHYGDKSQTLTRRQYFKADACRTDEMSSSGAVVRSTLRAADKIYAWETGGTQFFSGAAGAFTDDGAAMLPTYETVLALPQESITEAALINLNYEPCIFVRTKEDIGAGNYYISSVSGLLVRAELYEGETLARECALQNVSAVAPADSYFTLPNGNSVLQEKEPTSK